jgi:hypothetical protein
MTPDDLMRDADTDLPVVEARRGRRSGTWIVRCPYCGKEHGHGAITASRQHRVTDCVSGPGYFVVAGPESAVKS